MLSPSGRSSMWSAEADGYARGEGIAAVVLKTLSAALADGDHIECIIRATGVNQDGKTKGITVPSRLAQAELIKQTYASIGLDPNNPLQRCQYFEAHGTGTPAGDPIEAGAIAKAFFGTKNRSDTLYVGSIKTIIGHTEGTAGLAGVLKASLALKHKVIPPNMHFNQLSDTVKPFYKSLRIIKSAQAWPSVSPEEPRRASVNSFGKSTLRESWSLLIQPRIWWHERPCDLGIFRHGGNQVRGVYCTTCFLRSLASVTHEAAVRIHSVA